MKPTIYPTRLVGFAEMVKLHGDNWQYHGMFAAARLNDEGRRIAFMRADGESTVEWKEYWASLLAVKYNSRAQARAKAEAAK